VPKVAPYESYCPIARALDVLGDRWTMLIMRELANGDHRFTDLRRNLPGIAPNLLSQRLKDLIDEGLVATKELPPPAARTVYTATEYGRTTIPVLRALARFGFQRLEPANAKTELRPSAAVNSSLRPFYDRARAGDLDELYDIVVDGETFRLASAYGGSDRPASDSADLRLELPAWVLVDLRLGTISFEDAVARRLLTKRGSAASLRNFRRVFQLD
jgi:DNA-binding HxlR family transcriptional regulator